MWSIEGNKITLTHGDTLPIGVTNLKLNGVAYTPQEGDVIKWAVKTDPEDAEPILEKVIPNDTLQTQLTMAESESLPLGNLVWDLQITFANGTNYTWLSGKMKVLWDAATNGEDTGNGD